MRLVLRHSFIFFSLPENISQAISLRREKKLECVLFHFTFSKKKLTFVSVTPASSSKTQLSDRELASCNLQRPYITFCTQTMSLKKSDIDVNCGRFYSLYRLENKSPLMVQWRQTSFIWRHFNFKLHVHDEDKILWSWLMVTYVKICQNLWICCDAVAHVLHVTIFTDLQGKTFSLLHVDKKRKTE